MSADQPTDRPTKKVTAATASGALAVVVVYALGELDVHVTEEAAAGIATLLAFAGGYLKRE